jgi:hypothetical protein
LVSFVFSSRISTIQQLPFVTPLFCAILFVQAKEMNTLFGENEERRRNTIQIPLVLIYEKSADRGGV